MADYQLTREERLKEVVEDYRPFLEYAAAVRALGENAQIQKDRLPPCRRVFRMDLGRKVQ